MRVGVYVDGYNLYYGARRFCGGSTGWKWIDVRSLVSAVVAAHPAWAGATIERIAYCTARVDGATNPSAQADQDVYLKAIRTTKSVDLIEYGNYVSRVKMAPLATKDAKGRPVIVRSNWPIMVQDASRTPVPNAAFLVSYLHMEEKGSDVNVAAHLLADVLRGQVDAAVVVSNDSDLRLPLRMARDLVPVGVVNPQKGPLAGALKGSPSDGVGSHWWHPLAAADYYAHQLPDPAGRYTKPIGW